MSNAVVQVFKGVGQAFERREVPLPERLSAGEVLVAIDLATICGSDLHTVEGRRSAPVPCVLGHEGVGHVVASQRAGISAGQRVTWTLADSCGQCAPCRQWRLPQKCERLFKYGHAESLAGSGLNGCYASHIVLRSGTTVVPIPDGLSDPMVAPANCALATIVNALEILPDPCHRVLIQGSGLLGIYAAAWLQSRGIKDIYCIDLSAERLAVMPAFGGQPLLPGQPAPSFDLVLEVAGTSQVIDDGIKCLRPGGHYVWAGMVHPQTPLAVMGEAIVRKCLTVRGVHNYAPAHLEAGLAFLAQTQARFPWADLVSPALPLSDLDQAFEWTRQRRWPRVAVKP